MTTRKALALMGGSATWKPTDQDRERVRMYCWSGQPVHKIAEFMRVTEPEIRYHFWAELGVQQADMQGRIAAEIYNMSQDQELPPKVRLAALQYLGDRKVLALAPRKQADAVEVVIPEESKQLQHMTVEELERKIADLEKVKPDAQG